jgi:hypothetical protein
MHMQQLPIALSLALAFSCGWANADEATGSGRKAVVDCRAGCQGKEKNCQESLQQNARIDSQPGRFFDAATLHISRRWNASDSPGLVRDPNWEITRFPANDAHPTSLIITPVLATCVGRSPDTQGVTFYEWTADYFPDK